MVVHHHYTSHYNKLPETEFNIAGHFCPIPGFQYKSFTFHQVTGEMEGIRFLHKILFYRTQDPFVTPYIFSFSLRAPPLLDNIS